MIDHRTPAVLRGVIEHMLAHDDPDHGVRCLSQLLGYVAPELLGFMPSEPKVKRPGDVDQEAAS